MSLYADEDFQYGPDPALCPYCKEAVSGRCNVHRVLEALEPSPPENHDNDIAAGRPEDRDGDEQD